MTVSTSHRNAVATAVLLRAKSERPQAPDPRGHTNCPTVMPAERVAEVIAPGGLAGRVTGPGVVRRAPTVFERPVVAMLDDPAVARKSEHDCAGESGDLAVLIEDHGPVLDARPVTMRDWVAEPQVNVRLGVKRPPRVVENPCVPAQGIPKRVRSIDGFVGVELRDRVGVMALPRRGIPRDPVANRFVRVHDT